MVDGLTIVVGGCQNSHMYYKQKEVRNGVAANEGQGLGSSEEDESRVDDAPANTINGPAGTIQSHDGFQISQQHQPQGSVVCWERFLPTRSLRVLLVEYDDSTRHVVSALLRNCSYEVTAVSNGFQAWKILEDLTNRIDIVLTEVVMPVFSGIGLLSKIMTHKTLKTIPVIMMSSQDSMGIVFKCLSKGAVDFLVKPIRKNELKNLWQHVWRRCHSSSGSGSESGTQTKKSIKSIKSKSNDESENNNSSSDEHDNGSNGPSIRDGSDNGSGTQSSWTKKAVEADSHQSMPPSYPFSDAPDSICAQVIHAKPESYSKKWVGGTEAKDSHEQDEQLDDIALNRFRERGEPQRTNLQHEKLSTHTSGRRQSKLLELDIKPFESCQQELINEDKHGNGKDQATSLITAKANCTTSQAEGRDCDAADGPSDVSYLKENSYCNCEEIPGLELSLKRVQGVEDDRSAANEDCNVLRHSDFSAFSKYNTASSANQAPTGNVGSCSPLDNSSVAMKTETMQNFPSHSNGAPLNQQSNGSSNNNDMASTAKYIKPEARSDKSESMSAFKPFHSSTFQPLQNGCISSPSSQQVLSEKADELGVSKVQKQLKTSNHPVQVHNHHHHHHHHHRHYHQCEHDMKDNHSQQKHDVSLKNMAAAAPQCGSSNAFEGTNEINVGNYSMNGSASGSNHGSNGQNGSSAALNAGATNLESDNGAAGNSEVGEANVRIRGNVIDEDRVAQREAALTKFRLKRKERCFEKRVRYQSRKKLAEQRPRVKGQFVRQIASDSKGEKDYMSNDPTSEDNSWDSLR